MHREDLESEHFLNEIASDVFRSLSDMRFIELLDDRFCPIDEALGPVRCDHSFENTIEILQTKEVSEEDIEDVLAVLRSRGACCDCEVLYNIAETSRLKAKYWREKIRNEFLI